MDLIALQDNITILENSDTTPENVTELAALYTVRNNLQAPKTEVEAELNDILPYYHKYVSVKQRYQRNQAIDAEVIQGIKDVCVELQEFITALYEHTDMHKERMCIRKMIQQLAETYKD